MINPNSRWEKPDKRERIDPPPHGEWSEIFFKDEIPQGYRPLLKGESAQPGDYHHGPPNCATGQIWYIFHVAQSNFSGITNRRL